MGNNKYINIKSLRKSLILYISVAMVLLMVISVILTSLIQKQRQEQKEQEYELQIHRSIAHSINHYVNDYLNLANRIIHTTNISELLLKRDREGIHNLLYPKWEIMVEQDKNLDIMHIHLADGSSFYRAHLPDKFGDQLKKVRPMINEVHKFHKAIHGYETGKYQASFRVVVPIIDKEDRYLGAFEIGLNPKFILDAVAAINGFNGLIFIKADALGSDAIKNTMVIDGYSLQSKPTKELEFAMHAVKHLEDAVEIVAGDKKYFMHLFELKDFKNRVKVKILFFQDITEAEIFRGYMLFGLSIFVLLTLLILIIFIYRRIAKVQNKIVYNYKEQQDKLIFNQNYLQALFDVSKNIMLTSDGIEMERANPALLEFFDYETLEDFKNKHECICDFFLEEKLYLQAQMDDERWLDYIIARPKQLHKVCMMKGDVKHKFIVWATKLNLDEKNRSVINFSDITELEELSQRFEYAANGANDGLWDWNLEIDEIYFSPRYKSMLGYKEDEIKSNHQTWVYLHHPDDLKNVEKDLAISQKKPNQRYENIHRLRHKDGHWIWVLARGQAIFNNKSKAVRMVGTSTDITKQKELEAELLSKKLEFDMFMRFIPANILIKDSEGVIVYANEASNQFFGVDCLLGKTSQDILPPDKAKETDIFAQKVIKNGQYENLNEFYNYKNEKVIVRSLGFKIEIEDSIQIGLVITDITQSYLDKKALEEKEEVMILQSRHAAMGEMISMIAHQWRQPISVIAMGANNILADIELDILEMDTLRSGAKDIINQTQELSKTIDDFRNFFRPGKVAEEILPEDVFSEAFAIIGKSLENNNIEVISEIKNGKKLTTYSRELMQVLINILKNAKEALVEKRKEDRKIFVQIKDNDSDVIIKICDNAGGIKEEILNKIFNPYFTTKSEANGTGLGLYMSETIVHKHLNGSLSAYNKDDGACFEIILPYMINKQEDVI